MSAVCSGCGLKFARQCSSSHTRGLQTAYLYHSSLHAIIVRSSSLPMGGLQNVHPEYAGQHV